jgi:hypothetical protein
VAINRNYNIPQASQAIAVIRDNGNETINVFATREFYRWMSMIERLIGIDGPLYNVEDEVLTVEDQVNQNSTDIAGQASDINDLNFDVGNLSIDLSNHIGELDAHGANGNIVGFNDLAGIGR